MRQKVGSHVQPEKVLKRAVNAGVTHGVEALVRMPALQQTKPGHMVPCFGADWQVIKRLKEGDGGSMPNKVDYTGATMPLGQAHFDGVYHVSVNGAVHIRDLTVAERAILETVKV